MNDRNAAPALGPRFFMSDGVEMFEFVVDPNTVIGPRPATKADHERYPDEQTHGRRSTARDVAHVEATTRPKPPAAPESKPAGKQR